MKWITRQMMKPVLPLCALSFLMSPVAAGAQESPLQLMQTILLPGVEKCIDHRAVDLPHKRLFIAALGNNTVEVVDLQAGKRFHTISGLHEPQGLAHVPSINRDPCV